VLDFVQKYDKKDRAMKKALRAIRKETSCKEGIKVITGDGSVVESKEAEAQNEEEVVEMITGKPKKGRKRKNQGAETTEAETALTTPVELGDADAATPESSRKNRKRDRSQSRKERESTDRSGRKERRGKKKRKERQESA
jgi:hypothetical protein